MPSVNSKDRAEQIADADRIIADHSDLFDGWLESQGLTVDQAAAYSWGPLTSSLRSSGKLPQAEAWITEQQSLMVEMGVTTRKRTAGEIARRFLAAKMEGVEGTARPMKNQVKYLSHLPVHYVWAGLHPDFIPLPEEAELFQFAPAMYAVLKEVRGQLNGESAKKVQVILNALELGESRRQKRADEIKRYERKCPAPNQMAINMLLSCQLDKTARKDLFKETNNFTRDERKKVKTVKTEEEKEEDRACDDIDAEIERLSAKVRT